MLKLATFVIWIGPALILLGYLLWVSRKSLPSIGTDGAEEVEIKKPAAETFNRAATSRLANQRAGEGPLE